MVLVWRCYACHQKSRSKSTFAKKLSDFQGGFPPNTQFGLKAPKMLPTGTVAW